MLIHGENPEYASLKSGKLALSLSLMLVNQGVCIHAPQSLPVYSFPAYLLSSPSTLTNSPFFSPLPMCIFYSSFRFLQQKSPSLGSLPKSEMGAACLTFGTYNNSHMTGSEFLYIYLGLL